MRSIPCLMRGTFQLTRIHSLVFDEHASINQEICPISTIKHDLYVADRNRIFSVDIQSAQAEFIHRVTPIHRIQQSWPRRSHGLQLLNRQYDEQLLPYPLLYPTARQMNEPTLFLCGLGGLGGSKFKAQPASYIHRI